MMNCYQYKIVCQVKYEVLSIINTIQTATLQNVQKGLATPNPEVSKEYIEKIKHLQQVLSSNNIRQENFNLNQYVTECLQSADIHMNNYINCFNSSVSTKQEPR